MICVGAVDRRGGMCRQHPQDHQIILVERLTIHSIRQVQSPQYPVAEKNGNADLGPRHWLGRGSAIRPLDGRWLGDKEWYTFPYQFLKDLMLAQPYSTPGRRLTCRAGGDYPRDTPSSSRNPERRIPSGNHVPRQVDGSLQDGLR